MGNHLRPCAHAARKWCPCCATTMVFVIFGWLRIAPQYIRSTFLPPFFPRLTELTHDAGVPSRKEVINMTTQVPDTCTFDGRTWSIEQWDGDISVVPSNESLGIITRSVSTANWSGRIDHFVVFRDKLFLLKIEVNLAEESRTFLPKGAQREVLIRFENMHVFDKQGERDEIREHRFEYLVFHDLAIPYTGDLYLSYPCIDYWELPYEADEGDDDRADMVLSFEAGLVVGSDSLRAINSTAAI